MRQNENIDITATTVWDDDYEQILEIPEMI